MFPDAPFTVLFAGGGGGADQVFAERRSYGPAVGNDSGESAEGFDQYVNINDIQLRRIEARYDLSLYNISISQEHTMSHVTEIDLEWLRSIDTPTICNIIETIDPGRANFGYTFRHLYCVYPDMAPIVGYAKTATVRARRPVSRSTEESAVFREAYFDYVAGGTEPKISVVQDLDEQPGYGAMWGEVSTNVHKALGVKGVVTNGSVRDVDMVADDFQLLAGLIAPSRAHIHYCDFACEVNVHGMTVNDGDLIHADKHGAVVIPIHMISDMSKALDLLNRKEEAILSVAKSPNCTVDMLKSAHRVSADIKV